MVYQWKNGTRIKADAEKVGVELEKIKGDKTPEIVVFASACILRHSRYTAIQTAAGERAQPL